MPATPRLTRNLRAFAAAIVASAFALVAGTALAQPKPALTKEIDAPGRDAYQANRSPNVSVACRPIPIFCRLEFDPVPAGKRLVVTYVSLQFQQTDAVDQNFAWLGDLASPNYLLLPKPQLLYDTIFVLSTPITYYVNAGETPHLSFSGFNTAAGSSMIGTIVGHFVSVP